MTGRGAQILRGIQTDIAGFQTDIAGLKRTSRNCAGRAISRPDARYPLHKIPG